MSKQMLWLLVIIPLILYLSILSLLYFQQEQLIFPGTKLPNDFHFEFDVPFKEINVPVNGALINALHFQQENPQGIVFFLHGNAGNLKNWTTGVDFYRKVNYDLFIFDYRGYGKSTGKIQSQQQLLNDVRALWKNIKEHYKGKKTVFFGRSLGTFLATSLAVDEQPDLLILATPFSSITSMVHKHYPWAPSLLLRYPMRTDESIPLVSSKTIFFHGTKDDITPLSHSEYLQGLVVGENQLYVIDGAGHNDLQNFPTYYDLLEQALTKSN